jgi:hypothetical protein
MYPHGRTYVSSGVQEKKKATRGGGNVMSATVRVSEYSHGVLKRLAEQERISMVEALDRVAIAWERTSFFRDLNDSFAALRADPEAWQTELDERRLWDQSLSRPG